MEVNYKRINDTDGELTLRFSDYKELIRRRADFIVRHQQLNDNEGGRERPPAPRGKQHFRRGHRHLQPL